MIDDVIYDEDIAQILRERIEGNVRQMEPDAYRGDFSLTPELMPLFSRASLKESAVLIPLVMTEQDGLSVLLTKRAETLRTFPGQWVFPGGSADADDGSSVTTALRETVEEVGIQPHQIDIIGELPDYHVRSGFNMSPVVGIIKEPVAFTLDGNEVADTMVVPLEALFAEGACQTCERDFEGQGITLYEFSYQDIKVAGATAGGLLLLRDALLDENHDLDLECDSLAAG